MTEQRGLLAVPRPLRQHSANIGTPLTAAHELDMALQVQRMAFVDRVSSHSFAWPNALCAPFLETSTVNTDAIFYINDKSNTKDVDIGWLAHPNANILKAIAYVAVGNTDIALSLRLQTKTLMTADAVTTTKSDPFTCVSAGQMPRVADWHMDTFDITHPPWSLATCSMSLEPDYPADRTKPFAIQIYGSWAANTNPSNITTVRRAALMSLRIWDEVSAPDPES